MEQSNSKPSFSPPDPKVMEAHWDKFDRQAAMYKKDLKANYGSPYIIAINGLAGSGKSTLVKAFQKAVPASVVIPFAAPLKNAAAGLGWRGLKDEKGRKLLQLLGTEIVQDLIDRDHWVKLWLHGAHSVRMADLILCDDMRFPHEMALMKSIKATRINIRGRADASVPKHRSESALLKGFDYTFNNTGTLADMDTFVKTVLGEIL